MHKETSPTRPEGERQPPLSWFVGIGKEDTGIMTVVYGDEVSGMLDGKVGELIEEWNHYAVNLSARERNPKSEEILEEAERAVKKATGFTPRQLADKRSDLAKKYKGKKEAPFQVELY